MEVVSVILLCFASIVSTSNAVDTLAVNQTLRDGDTIVSAGGSFEMGFFQPGNSTSYRYLAIWYKKISTGTSVWVANNESPLNDTTGVLMLNPNGILVLSASNNNAPVWSSNSTRSGDTNHNPVVQLLDTGNLVVRDENDDNPENYIWQSFDHPGNTLLPGMKFGKNFVTGQEWSYRSWRSVEDPAPGDYTAVIDTNGFPQFYMKKGSVVEFRPGPWDGLRFSGEPNLRPNPIYTFDFVLNQEEAYYKYELVNSSVVTRMTFTIGNIERLLWINRSQEWKVYLTTKIDNCDSYGFCGAYGHCDINNSPACGCLQGFEPKVQGEWDIGDWSKGCIRSTNLSCGTDGFRKYTGLKLPDTQKSWYNQSMDLLECEMVCASNCNCTAYANTDIRGSGCLLWFGDLIDMRENTEGGQDIYIRMASSELEKDRSSRRRQVRTIVVPLLSALLVIGVCLLCVFKRRAKKREGMREHYPGQDYPSEEQKEDMDLPFFTLPTLLRATNNFSADYKLGEGGFGPVYKGRLEDGREIAVKRLAKTSTQGIDEFKNEVITISKLQHRNLVRLLGCCIQDDEKMLVYEYMPNRGLDSFIFDETQRKLLDWPTHLDIINGIARGLLYLHQDSRLRIIHRDLKASNILLDLEMKPKISDFGMARSFGGNETEANTKRVVGTYGYMSPEYAGEGIFSEKSDVFSFGVLLLEIVSGKKNRGFYHPEHSHNLLGHAWKLHKDGRSLDLVDASIEKSDHLIEVLRLIQIGLLCVQQRPEDRPSMSSVVLMLMGEGRLPEPNQPGFYSEDRRFGPESSSGMNAHSATNEITITLLDPR